MLMKKGIGIILSVNILVGCSREAPDPTGVSRAQLVEADGAAATGGETCAHSTCTAGIALDQTCSVCATTVCTVDPFCCQVSWDETCVGEGTSLCTSSCDVVVPDSGPSACVHPVCEVGGVLMSNCDPCAAAVCAADPYCCTGSWDTTCVGEAVSICGAQCQ